MNAEWKEAQIYAISDYDLRRKIRFWCSAKSACTVGQTDPRVVDYIDVAISTLERERERRACLTGSSARLGGGD